MPFLSRIKTQKWHPFAARFWPAHFPIVWAYFWTQNVPKFRKVFGVPKQMKSTENVSLCASCQVPFLPIFYRCKIETISSIMPCHIKTAKVLINFAQLCTRPSFELYPRTKNKRELRNRLSAIAGSM